MWRRRVAWFNISLFLTLLSYLWPQRDPIAELAQSYFPSSPRAITEIDLQGWKELVLAPDTDRGATAILAVIDGAVRIDRTMWKSTKDWEEQRLQHIINELRIIASSHQLPNFQFIFNAADCPPRNLPNDLLTFGVTRCQRKSIIPLPQWLPTRDGPFAGWDDRVEEALIAGAESSWDEKEPRAVFMGYLRHGFFTWNTQRYDYDWNELGTHNCEDSARCKMAKIAKLHPDLFDVRIWTGDHRIRETLGLIKQPFMTMAEQARRYRYAVYLEGSCGWADRLKYLLAHGFVIFIQSTSCHEWFFPLLRPWIHYIPIKNDLLDLVEMINWAKNNDIRSRIISDNARTFALEYLAKDAWRRYFREVIKLYAM